MPVPPVCAIAVTGARRRRRLSAGRRLSEAATPAGRARPATPAP